MSAAWLRVPSACLLAWLALSSPTTRAHEFTVDAVINAFVRIDAGQAHLVVRAPLFLFRSAKFPVKGGAVDVGNAAAAKERALGALGQSVAILENGQPLIPSSVRGRLTLPSDRSFEDYERALAHVRAPIEPDTTIYVDQGFVDAEFVYPIASPGSVFSLRTTAGIELGEFLKVAVRYLPATGDARALVINSTMGTVALNPSWWGASTTFVGFGIAHILTGFDHLLFLLCLVIPLRGIRQLLTVVTGFTLAHSVTLIGSAFDLAPGGAWFPPFVEFVIALSIVYMALENIIGVDLKRRLLLTMLFGLVHGFGFSYGLREDLQFAGSHLVVSLLAFNIGIEIGQILVLLVMLPALALVTRYVLPGRVGTIILGALIAHVGWHWMGERWEGLVEARWPRIDVAGVATLLLWMAALALLGGLIAMVVNRLRLEPASPASAGGTGIAGARVGD